MPTFDDPFYEPTRRPSPVDEPTRAPATIFRSESAEPYAEPFRRGGTAAVETKPLDVTVSGTSATVEPGTVNGLLPSNIFAEFLVPETGTRYFVLNVTAASGVVSGVTISVTTTEPGANTLAKGVPPASFKVLFAMLVDGVVSRTIGAGSIQATPTEFFREQKPAPAPDELPYDVWYSWAISA